MGRRFLRGTRRGILAVGLAVLVAGGTAAGAEGESFHDGAGIRRFDFGPPDSPLLAGFKRVTHADAYDRKAGFGWVTRLEPVTEDTWGAFKQPVITSRVRDFPDDAARDHVYGFSGYGAVKPIAAAFQVDVPNGEYLIRISVGDSGCGRWTNPFHIDVNGVRQATDVAPGSDTPMKLTGKVADGRLRIAFTANPKLSAQRCKQHRWTTRIFTLWTVDYLMIYPAAKAALFDKDLATFRRVTLANMTARFVPKGRLQRFEVRDGCVVRDGKPMFFNHRHEWGFTRGEFLQVLKYFAFGNAVMSHRGTAKVRGGVKFLTPAWREGGRFPGEMFAEATAAYEAGMLCTAYGGVYSFLSAAVKDSPGRCTPTWAGGRGSIPGSSPATPTRRCTTACGTGRSSPTTPSAWRSTGRSWPRSTARSAG
jgi:hypothetical protein